MVVLFSFLDVVFGSFGSRHRLTYPLTLSSRGWASVFRCLVLGLLVVNIQVHFVAGSLEFWGFHFQGWLCRDWVVVGCWTLVLVGYFLLSRRVGFPSRFGLGPRLARCPGQSWIGGAWGWGVAGVGG
ncbi:MAG: hypothetical protein JWM04_1555 [Verrucomicrobiales bacterium]|nr:hypothetical protein [Verrucomicrobiales bacterium]